MNIIEVLDETAARSSGETALVWGPEGRERSVAFGAFAAASRRIAALLRQEGLRPGDAVVIFLPISALLYEVVAAVLRLGMIPVFVDPVAWKNSLDRALAGMPVRAFVGSPAACMLRWFVPSLRRIPLAFVAGPPLPGARSLRDADRCKAIYRVEDCPAGATAMLTFTSGSSGEAKGVLRSHGELLATLHSLRRHFLLETNESRMTVLPFFAFAHLAAGTTSVIPPVGLRCPAAADPASLVRRMRAWNASGLVVTPFLMRRIAEYCARSGQRLGFLRRVYAGGAAVTLEAMDAFSAIAPHAGITAVYGATEAEPIALAERSDFGPEDREAIANGGGVPVGRPIDDILLRILADEWGKPSGAHPAFAPGRLPVQVQGEIVVSGPHVSSRYLGGEANRLGKILVDGSVWHRTGDAGYLDQSGRLWLVGRCAAKVADDLGVLYPLRVEAALSGVKNVCCATMVLRADRRVLVVQPGGDTPDLGEIVSRVAWSRPAEVVLVKSIPMDRRHNSKVNYPALNAMLVRREWRARVPLPATAMI